ncbi:MAG: hypothetical protein M3286_00585, partial [Thermoproteota archaeon]|nr:hypothetical protein [Thermoproteota archaeon]
SHIKVLEQLRFVEHENLGRLKVYRTTSKFQNYFGITDLSVVKSRLVTSNNATTTRAKANKNNNNPKRSTTQHLPFSAADAASAAAATGASPTEARLSEKT